MIQLGDWFLILTLVVLSPPLATEFYLMKYTIVRSQEKSFYNLRCIISKIILVIKVPIKICTWNEWSPALHSSEATCVIRRKSQHPDMWAVLMTRLHCSLLAFGSKAIATSTVYAKSERRPVYFVKVTRYYTVKVDRNQIEYDKWYIYMYIKPKQYYINMFCVKTEKI